jgi:hypothetical protein
MADKAGVRRVLPSVPRSILLDYSIHIFDQAYLPVTGRVASSFVSLS